MEDTVTANEKITKLNTMYHELVSSACRTFNEVAAMKGVTGVYIVIGADAEVVYIGSTNKFHIRFGTDLKHESTHTLIRKFLKGNVFAERKLAREHIEKVCRFKVMACDNKRQAEALEHLAIWLLNPRYNK